MDDLFQKYKQALSDLEKTNIELQKSNTERNILREELNLLKQMQNNNINNKDINKENKENKDNELQEQEMKFRKYVSDLRRYVLGLLGYDIEVKNDTVELLSLYAFNSDDKFIFLAKDGKVEMLSNEFAESYKNEIEEYLIKGKSFPAFLAKVTCDLWNKKTFQ